MGENDLMEFLEDAIRDTIEQDPKKVVVAYLDENDCVTFSNHQCNYRDLQHVGQEMINEGILRLIAESEDRIEGFKDESEEEENG